jgi:hypothetical protein
MAGIQLRITELQGIRVYADRTADIVAIDQVRGPVTISLDETSVRYLWASVMDGNIPVEEWRREDDAKEE